eukprot:CFRG0403T1
MSAHPPLMRRLRGNDLRSIQLAKNKEILAKYDLEKDWFDAVNECAVQPALIISEAEVKGELLRLITEYLRLRFTQSIQPDSPVIEEGEDCIAEDETPKPVEQVPHPQSALGVKVVGTAYKALVTAGLEVYQMQMTRPDIKDDKVNSTILHDGVKLCKASVVAVDDAIATLDSTSVVPVKSLLGDILVYADQGKRQTMEDKHVCISDLNAMFLFEDLPPQAFFAIYDGHGGIEAADYARNHLHVNLVNHPEFKTDVIKALQESFKKTDNDFLIVAERESILSGCTCIVTFVRGSTIYTAWLGDSQAMLCRNGEEVKDMCCPHKPDREDEKKRIEDAGGVVVWYGAWRVNGVLSVARAIGDRQLKKYVISECDTTVTAIEGGENFLCLACDGLWDVMDGDDVINYVREHMKQGRSTNDIAKALVKHALQLGSADNISTIIVFFDGIHSLHTSESTASEDDRGEVKADEGEIKNERKSDCAPTDEEQ